VLYSGQIKQAIGDAENTDGVGDKTPRLAGMNIEAETIRDAIATFEQWHEEWPEHQIVSISCVDEHGRIKY
jgi:hypothetical protein